MRFFHQLTWHEPPKTPQTLNTPILQIQISTQVGLAKNLFNPKLKALNPFSPTPQTLNLFKA